MAVSGGGGNANAVRAGEAFVEISTRNERLRAGLGEAKSKFNEFAESGKKVLAGFGGNADGLLGTVLGGSEGLGGVAGLAGVLGPAGVVVGGLTLMVARITAIRDKVKELGRELADAAAAASVRLTEERSAAIGKDVEAIQGRNDDDLLQRELELKRKESQARAERHALEPQFAALAERARGLDKKRDAEELHKIAVAEDALNKRADILAEAETKARDAAAATRKEIEQRQREAGEKAVAADKERRAAELKSLDDLAASLQRSVATEGMSPEEAALFDLRQKFTPERLAAMKPKERDAVEQKLGEAEAAAAELKRIRERPEAVKRAFRDAFGGKPAPELGTSQGAFQASSLRQVLGGTTIDKRTVGELEKSNSLLASIDGKLDKLKGVFL